MCDWKVSFSSPVAKKNEENTYFASKKLIRFAGRNCDGICMVVVAGYYAFQQCNFAEVCALCTLWTANKKAVSFQFVLFLVIRSLLGSGSLHFGWFHFVSSSVTCRQNVACQWHLVKGNQTFAYKCCVTHLCLRKVFVCIFSSANFRSRLNLRSCFTDRFPGCVAFCNCGSRCTWKLSLGPNQGWEGAVQRSE